MTLAPFLKANRFFVVSIIGALVLSIPARGQAPGTPLAASVAALHQRYAESFVGNPELYSGPEYVDYALAYHARVNHQYFLTPAMRPGSVDYRGQSFNNIRLTYDVVRDQVVLGQPTNPLTLHLLSEYVRAFTIESHHFVRLQADSSAGKVIRTGFYEVLADGPVELLARRAKRMQKQVVQPYINVEFIPTERLFMRKGGTYYAVGSKAAALRLMADRSKEVQQYVQQNQLSFKKDFFETSLTLLARYYNSLSQQ